MLEFPRWQLVSLLLGVYSHLFSGSGEFNNASIAWPIKRLSIASNLFCTSYQPRSACQDSLVKLQLDASLLSGLAERCELSTTHVHKCLRWNIENCSSLPFFSYSQSNFKFASNWNCAWFNNLFPARATGFRTAQWVVETARIGTSVGWRGVANVSKQRWKSLQGYNRNNNNNHNKRLIESMEGAVLVAVALATFVAL